MSDAPSHPVPHQIGPDRASIHGTAVSINEQALLILGPSGAGKSGLAAQLIALGGKLVADDMVHLRPSKTGLVAHAPPNGPGGIELRGIGIVRPGRIATAPLAAAILLSPSSARLPEPEFFEALGRTVPLLRHPATADLAAKLLLWMTARDG